MSEFLKKPALIFICFALTASTLLVFWQVQNYDFISFDDQEYVYENQHVLDGLTKDSVLWAFTSGYAANWHPVTWLSLMLDCQLFGTNPGRMHMVNVLLHLTNTLLLFGILKKMTGSLWPSVFVAAAFALHPMHVESVAWIAERKDVLSTFFLLLTLAAYAEYVKRPSAFRYTAALMLFALGLMAKPMLVTLPFILLLLDYWPLNRLEDVWPEKISISPIPKSAPRNNKRSILYRLVIEKVPFITLSVISSTLTFLVQRVGGAITEVDVLSLENRFTNVFLSYMRYIGKMFWPENLAVLYPYDAAGSISFWIVAISVLLLIGITFLVLRLGRTRTYLPVGWFWFTGTLIPVIGLVQVGPQAYADRYSYIPYIGLFIMIGWGLPELLSKRPYRKAILSVSMVLVLMALGICSYQQVSFWKNSYNLFSHALEVTKNNYIMHNSLGVSYTILGRYEEAIEAHQQAIRIKPDYADAYYNLGLAFGRLGRYPEEIEANQKAIQIKPDLVNAHNNLGVAYFNLGRYPDAIQPFKQAIRLKPDYAEAHNNLGNAYYRLGRHPEAIEAYRQATRIKPDYAEAYNNLGLAYFQFGRYPEAIEAYQKAIRIKPDFVDAHNNLGVAYFNLGRYPEAIESFKQAIRLKPDYAKAHTNLGNAYANLDRWQEAIEAYRQALRIKPDLTEAHQNLDLCQKAIEAKNRP